MNKLLVLIYSGLILISFSCKKRETEDPNKKCLMVQDSYSTDNIITETSSYSYDSKKRITSIIKKEGIDKKISTFSYTEIEITQVDQFYTKDLLNYSNTYVYRIGYEGRIDFMRHGEALTVYTYNKEGYLTRLTHSINNKVTSYSDLVYTDNTMTETNENNRTYITTFSNIKAPDNYIFPEYPDYPQHWVLSKYFGKRINYLISSSGTKEYPNHNTYTYKFDNKSNVISATTNFLVGKPSVRTPSYNCN